MSRKLIRILHPGGLKIGNHTKVFVDGVDISGNVTQVDITITPGKLPAVKLTVIDVEIDVSSVDPALEAWVSEGGYADDKD